MATYKKRGFKGKVKPNRLEEIENKSTTANVFKSLDDGSSKTQAWVEKNQNKILTLVGLVIISLASYYAYSNFVVEPNEINASNEIYFSQQKFEEALPTKNDSIFDIALNGENDNLGFIELADKFSGTKAGNLANYYIGMIYLKKDDYQNTIKYLSNFKSNDIILSSISLGSIGDAFSELNQYEEAFEFYSEAHSVSDNNYTTPIYLFKSGIIALELGKSSIAFDNFKKIKYEYSDSPQANNIDVYISNAEALK